MNECNSNSNLYFHFKTITMKVSHVAGTVLYSVLRPCNTFSLAPESYSSTFTTIAHSITSSSRWIWFCALLLVSFRCCHKFKREFHGQVCCKVPWLHCTPSIWLGQHFLIIPMQNATPIFSQPIKRPKSHSTIRVWLDWSFGWSVFCTVHWNQLQRYPNWQCPISKSKVSHTHPNSKYT